MGSQGSHLVVSDQPFFTTFLRGGPTGKPKEKRVLIDPAKRRKQFERLRRDATKEPPMT